MSKFLSRLCLVDFISVLAVLVVLTSLLISTVAVKNQEQNSFSILDFKTKYLIKNDCSEIKSLKAVLLVTSRAANFHVRRALRAAYSAQELLRLGVHRVFLLGTSPDAFEEVQVSILQENNKYNDILQGDFLDAYKNLTYKNVMGLRWAADECTASYVMKMDDDTVLNVRGMLDQLSSGNSSYDVFGRIFKNAGVIRNIHDKWYVTREEFDLEFYPPYTEGFFYTIKHKSLQNLLESLNSTRFFWIDDVFITGILARNSGMVLKGMDEESICNQDQLRECIRTKPVCKCIVGRNIQDHELNVKMKDFWILDLGNNQTANISM